MSARDALLRHHQKLLDKSIKAKRKKPNKKPEKITETNCMRWLNDFGFSCHVVESKAVFSVASGGYKSGQTIPGFADIAGCTPDGWGCFIELKAKGRRSNLSDAQREFLKEKILKGCFACVVDCEGRLRETYMKWRSYHDKEDRITFLMNDLPKKRIVKDDDDFL